MSGMFVSAILAAALAPMWGEAIAPTSSEGEWKAGVDHVSVSWSMTSANHYAMRFDVALKPGWHTYWQNPGDSGAAPKFAWTLPPGWTAREVQYPRPEAKLLDDLPFFGYEGSATYVVEVVRDGEGASPAAPAPAPGAAPAAPAAAANTWHLTATILVCKEICVQGKFAFSGALPPATPSEPVTLSTQYFGGRALPRQAQPSQVTARVKDDTLRILGPARGHTTVRFIPASLPGLSL
ncbi:MAG: hypothetical protein JNK53_02905 [Phycisphaerae bacterium]|nr:hypothetical protein [Phycisphaerae bacterium]